MLSESAPVVVMRCFRDGAGYAYDARVDSPTLTAIIGALGEVFARPPGPPFHLPLADGRVLLGDKQVDHDCLDEKAVGRHPTIVRAVLLERAVRPRLEARLCRQLAALPLPTTPGPQSSGLSLPLTAPPRVPEPGVSLTTALLRRAPWVVAAVLLLAEAALYATPQLGGTLLASGCRALVILLVAGLASVLVPRVPSRADLDRLEEEWTEGDGQDGRFPPTELLDDEAAVVLPSGRLVSAAELRAPGGLLLAADTPVAVSDSQPTAARCYLGLAVVQGHERLHLRGGAETRCTFVRCYTSIGLGWRLVLVQWTSATDDLAPTRAAAGASALQAGIEGPVRQAPWQIR